jgi:hypothetical protein
VSFSWLLFYLSIKNLQSWIKLIAPVSIAGCITKDLYYIIPVFYLRFPDPEEELRDDPDELPLEPDEELLDGV